MNARLSKLSLSVVLIVLLASGLLPAAQAQEGPTSDPNDPLIAYVLGWWNTIMTPSETVTQEAAEPYRLSSFIWHDPGTPQVTIFSHDLYFLDWSNEMRQKTANRHLTLDRIVRYGDLVWLRMVEEATLQEPLTEDWARSSLERLQLPLDFSNEEVLILRIENGEIAETWEYMDHPVIWYVFQDLVCSGWSAPLAGADMGPDGVAAVDDHVLLMEGEKIAVVQDLFDRINAQQSINASGVLKTSFLLHNPRGPEVWAIPSVNMQAWFSAMHEIMPDFHIEIQHIVEDGDMVWTHWRSTGTLTNPSTYPGLSEVNSLKMPRKVEAEGAYLFRFEESKIAEWWWYEDNNLLTIASTGLCLPKLQF